jgi:hypothetical protein
MTLYGHASHSSTSSDPVWPRLPLIYFKWPCMATPPTHLLQTHKHKYGLPITNQIGKMHCSPIMQAGFPQFVYLTHISLVDTCHVVGMVASQL